MDEDIKIRSQVETDLLRKNARLERKIEDDKLLIEYLSMMSGIEIPDEEEIKDDTLEEV